jgi:Flavodoxin-like fold
MTRILHIESSARSGAASYSRRFAADLVARLAAAAGPDGAEITVRDLAAAPLPHVDDAFVAAMFVPADERTPAQHRVLDRFPDQLGLGYPQKLNQPRASAGVMLSMAGPSAVSRASAVRAATVRSLPLSFDQLGSIGEKSGE